MEAMDAHSGLPAFDQAIQGLRLGDNVVFQVEDLQDYRYFARPFAEAGLQDGRRVVYLRFAPHEPVVDNLPGLHVEEVHPHPGFDYFSRTVHKIVEGWGREVYYVFDNLSSLVAMWATDELLANFFQVTCPYLLELRTVAYFALTRGHHANSAVARIRDTTQVLLDVYHVKDRMYVHPLKVSGRYSSQMFLPHEVSEEAWTPVSQSAAAADVLAAARTHPIRGAVTSIAPWDMVFLRLRQHGPAADDRVRRDPEVVALKRELCRMMIGADPQFSELADRYLTVADLMQVRDRMIGSGRIGGKAAGMLLARRVLATPDDDNEVDFNDILEGHDSFFIGSDVFFTFLIQNDLFRLRLNLTRDSQFSREEFAQVQQRFLSGEFPPQIVEQFRNMLDYFGQAPIIARSSSLLEDSFEDAFAGKYRSVFCANQGDPDQRLADFMQAVKLVYASTVNPDALAYRRKRGLGESDEQMAILVQRVSGQPHGHLFFPTMAGVAFSRNLYAWSDRIDPAKGIIRLVFGLGTRAVERVGNDYPRMIAVSHPELRPELGTRIAKYSQRYSDVIDLKSNRLVTWPVEDVLAQYEAQDLGLLVSVMQDGYLSDPSVGAISVEDRELVLTFNNLIRRTRFVPLIGTMLSRLERAYGRPLDTEFTASVEPDGRVRINLLQCRPLHMPGSSAEADIDVDRPGGKVLFRSARMVFGGVVRDIRYILYIDPRRYSDSKHAQLRRELPRIVGRINEHPQVVEGKLLMMGPGRWGSSNIDLGIGVGYADIDNAAVLVELAREEAGHLPEVSYGTHFFQDLVEAQVIFLAVYPDDAEAEFNRAFFEDCPNALSGLIPYAGNSAALVKLIDVPAVTEGAHAHVVADSQARKAVCFIE